MEDLYLASRKETPVFGSRQGQLPRPTARMILSGSAVEVKGFGIAAAQPRPQIRCWGSMRYRTRNAPARRGASPQTAKGLRVSGWPLVYLAPSGSAGLPVGGPNRQNPVDPGGPRVRSMRRHHPGPGLALRRGDFDLGHQLGDLAAQRNGVRAALQGCEVEPFVRRDGKDEDDGTASRCATALAGSPQGAPEAR